MRKKIKDLTLEEFSKICNETDYCSACPFYDTQFCGYGVYPYEFDFDELEMEVEVNDD